MSRPACPAQSPPARWHAQLRPAEPERDGVADVLPRQMGIIHENIVNGTARGQLVEDDLNRDARAAIVGLPS